MAHQGRRRGDLPHGTAAQSGARDSEQTLACQRTAHGAHGAQSNGFVRSERNISVFHIASACPETLYASTSGPSYEGRRRDSARRVTRRKHSKQHSASLQRAVPAFWAGTACITFAS